MSQAIPFKCSNLKCRRQFRAVVLPFKCSCGAVYSAKSVNNEPVPESSGIPCIHRGPAVRDLNCGCNGKPKVYECKLGGECVLRYLPKMKPEDRAVLTNCLDCELREEPA